MSEPVDGSLCLEGRVADYDVRVVQHLAGGVGEGRHGRGQHGGLR